MTIALVVYVALFLLARIWVNRLARKVSVDEYFWLLYRKEAIRQNRIPPVLNQYLLDVRQWYPPLYGWFLKVLPEKLFERRNLVSDGLVLLRFVNYLVVAAVLGVRIDSTLFMVCAVVYLASPALFIYDNQLNSRVLASIVFDLSVVLVFAGMEHGWQWGLAVSLLVTYVIVIYLHKLTLQLLVFLCLCWAALVGEAMPLLIMAASFLVAFLFGYRDILVAHWDISSFWYRYRSLLGAHQINDSPLYGVGAGRRLSVKKAIMQAVTILAMCPFIAIPLLQSLHGFWSITILGVLSFAFLTTFVPVMRMWGHGRSYMYYAPSLIILFLLTGPDAAVFSDPQALALHMCVLLALYSLVEYRKWLVGKTVSKDRDFEFVVEYLRTSALNRIMCIPIALSDEIAFRTGKTVLWGAHGYGFMLLEPYFPVLRVEPEVAVRDWNLGGVLVDGQYWQDHSAAFPTDLFELLYQRGKYTLYAVKGWRDESKYPSWALDSYPGLVPYGKSIASHCGPSRDTA